MRAQIRILTGAKAGLAFTFAQENITIGRHPDADLQFSPDGDLVVSAHHAMIWTNGSRWFLRDLDSRNGTFVNGARVSGDVPLDDPCQITFGQGGPIVEFRLAPAAVFGDVVPEPLETRRVAAIVPPRPATDGPPSPTDRIRAEVARQTRPLRNALGILAVVFLGVAGVFLYSRQSQRASWDRQRASLEQRIDSILDAGERAIRSLEGELEGLARALRESRDQVRTLGVELERARSSGDTSQIALLRRRLQAATVALERQQLAAALDFRAIERANRPAVAMIYVESDDGEIATATAFAVRPDATLLTNRHVLLGADGTGRPRRIAVQFSDSEQVWPARILAISDDADLALVKVDNIIGDVPAVRSLNARTDTIAAGAPVASIGFPLGGDVPRPGARTARRARPLIVAGVVSGRMAGRIEFRGYGATGASGSPIFDANGEVVAILYAGRQDALGHIVLGVPASAAIELLAEIR